MFRIEAVKRAARPNAARRCDATIKCLWVKLIVVDNHSTDGSIEMLRDEYPQSSLLFFQKVDTAHAAFNIDFANAGRQSCVVLDNNALLEEN